METNCRFNTCQPLQDQGAHANTSGIKVYPNILRKSKLDLSHVICVTMIRVTISLQVQHVWVSRHSFYRSTVLWFLKQAKQILNPHNSHPILQNVTFRFFRQRLHLPLVIFTGQCPVWTTPSRTLCWREENSPISAFTSSSRNSSWVNSPWARTPNLMIWYQKEAQRVAYIFKNYDSSSLFQCMITTSNE